MATGFSDLIIFFSLFPTISLMHNMPYEKQPLSMQLAKLNFIVCYF